MSNLFPISYPVGRAWYVLEINSRANIFNIEGEIGGELGLDCYIPKERRFAMRRRRKMAIVRALMPGYAFVNFDVDRDEWENILEIDGVIDVLSQNEIPIRIGGKDHGVIDRLRRAEMAGAFDFTIPAAAFGIGDIVEIREGAFTGMLARIKSATAKKRVQIILDFLGRSTVLDIDPCFLAKAV